LPSRNSFDLLVKIIVVLSQVIASDHDVVVPEFFGVKLRIVMCPIMRRAPPNPRPLPTISPLGIMLRTSRTSPLSQSDLVPWPECDLKRCPLWRCCWGMSGHAADMAKPTRMTHLGHQQVNIAVTHNALTQ
jgi:hypothetical protein